MVDEKQHQARLLAVLASLDETRGCPAKVDLHNCWETPSWRETDVDDLIDAFFTGSVQHFMDVATGIQADYASGNLHFLGRWLAWDGRPHPFP